MYDTSIHRGLPRAGIDRIDDAATALAIIGMAVDHPLRSQTIVLLLDDARRGRAIVVVSGTNEPDAVVDVVERLAPAFDDVGAMVVASIRPAPVPHDGDVDRWLEMSEIASLAGLDVLEWFVIDDSVRCPRDDLGEPPRW